MNMNLHHMAKFVNALPPQSIASATVNGTAIDRPWESYKQLAFLLLGGAFAASASGLCVIEGQRIDDDSWEPLKESDGTTDLQFTATALDDTGAAEDGALIGTLATSRIDATTYKAVRPSFTAENANAQLVGIGAILFDPIVWPSGQGRRPVLQADAVHEIGVGEDFLFAGGRGSAYAGSWSPAYGNTTWQHRTHETLSEAGTSRKNRSSVLRGTSGLLRAWTQ